MILHWLSQDPTAETDAEEPEPKATARRDAEERDAQQTDDREHAPEPVSEEAS